MAPSRKKSSSKPKDSLKVGPLTYRILYEPALRHRDDECNGLLDYQDSVIQIREGLPPTVERVTLIHEAIHGILFNSGFEEHDERLIEALSHGIVALLDDNPWLCETSNRKE